MNLTLLVAFFIYTLGFLGIVFVLAGFIALFAGPRWRGAPYVPTSRKRIEAMIEMSRIKPHEHVVDLGAGDGRIVIAFARHGADVEGYEINPILVLWARMRIRFAGLHTRVHVTTRDYWKENLSRFDVVTVYGFPPIMDDLRQKLEQELHSGARVLSNGFQVPGWESVEQRDGVYLYEVI